MTLWLNVTAVQLAVLWQDAHLAGDPKRPLWTVSAWQLAQVVPGRAEALVAVAAGAGDADVRAGQREAGARMAERRRRPPLVVRMAARAIAAERAAVDVLAPGGSRRRSSAA